MYFKKLHNAGVELGYFFAFSGNIIFLPVGS